MSCFDIGRRRFQIGKILSGLTRNVRWPLRVFLVVVRSARMSTYGIVSEKPRGRYEKRQVISIEAILPSHLSVDYDAVVPAPRISKSKKVDVRTNQITSA